MFVVIQFQSDQHSKLCVARCLNGDNLPSSECSRRALGTGVVVVAEISADVQGSLYLDEWLCIVEINLSEQRDRGSAFGAELSSGAYFVTSFHHGLSVIGAGFDEFNGKCRSRLGISKCFSTGSRIESSRQPRSAE